MTKTGTSFQPEYVTCLLEFDLAKGGVPEGHKCRIIPSKAPGNKPGLTRGGVELLGKAPAERGLGIRIPVHVFGTTCHVPEKQPSRHFRASVTLDIPGSWMHMYVCRPIYVSTVRLPLSHHSPSGYTSLYFSPPFRS